MKKKRHIWSVAIITLIASMTLNAATVLEADWKDVIRGNCSDQNSAWWSSSEAIRIAENVLLYQREIGGWPKNTNMQLVLTQTQKDALNNAKSTNEGCTIDNGAVNYELTYLSKVYKAISDAAIKAKIKAGFQLGVHYLIEAQYDNGGWPQFYPYRGGYSNCITYNDDAMINVMYILRHVYTKDGTYPIDVEESTIQEAKDAYDKGIECILNTQYIQDNKLTVWCAQHDEETLEPALARSYELPSLSGQESEGILNFLMSISNPSERIKRAIHSGALWYARAKITGQRKEYFTNGDGLSDYRIVSATNASPMWARFYTLEDNRPFFCDRDGIMKFSVSDIGYERRNGYSWYNSSGNEVASAYSSWIRKWGTSVVASPFDGQIVYTKDTVNILSFANKYSGHTFDHSELILDGTTYSYSTQFVDTLFTNLEIGDHSIVLNAVYGDDYVETDTVNFAVSLPVYTLTMSWGTGAGIYSIGSEITIHATEAPEGRVFSHWKGDTAYVEDPFDSVTVVTMPEEDIKVYASYTLTDVGVENPTLKFSDNIYPNPVMDYVILDLSEIGNADIIISDIQGRQVHASYLYRGINRISLENLTPGYYFVKVKTEDSNIYTSKLLVLGQ